MIRKAIGIVMFLAGILCVSAQMPQLTPLPLDPKVKHGVLPNGLNYYIMHNEEPKERANFYIAQKVGSTLETQEQLGLAHFLEHMAFNGTTHYPGKSMLNYLQGKGIRFGQDINAYTSFDETVYRINNVPTTDKPLMDSVLLVLHDWSGEILLEESEINAERGVIQEEWRQRSDANNRMYTTILPQIYQEYQYQQMPIGKMEVVMNFPPEALRSYYKKWYRPDQQGIVIVGDFDADEMERKVKELFSTIVMPENAAERQYPTVSDNEEPIFVSFTDPELSNSRVTVSYKSEKVPFEIRNTQEIFLMQDLPQILIQTLVNNRLQEASESPECKYSQAGVYFGDFYVSKTKDSFNIVAIPKTDVEGATKEAMEIVVRAFKTGFTDTEYDRVKEELLSSLETQYNERDKTNNAAFGTQLCRHFVDNEPQAGIEAEYEMIKAVLPQVPVDAINMMCKQILTDSNMVVVVSEPSGEGKTPAGKEKMLSIVKDAMHAEYEAYVDEVITEPLIAKLPKPGKVKSVTTDKTIGAEVFTLSNGVKVYVKTTDFASDEILMQAFREGGKKIYPVTEADNVRMLEDAIESSKTGPFDNKQKRKYYAGKQVSLSTSVNNNTDIIEGSSTVKDLPYLMELIYATFTSTNADYDTYKANAEKLAVRLENLGKNPMKVFGDVLNKTMYPDNPIMQNATAETVKAADYDKMLGIIHDIYANAAEYTFIFVGNVDAATLRPLLEQYIATLPAKKVKKVKPVKPIEFASGKVSNIFTYPMQTPTTSVFEVISGKNIPYNEPNSLKVQMVGDILDIIYTETLREEEGGTYGASVQGQFNPNNGQWYIIYNFQTNKDQQQQLIDRAKKELNDLLANGATEEKFNKVKQAMLKQLEIQERQNGWWINNSMNYLRGYDSITDARKNIEDITLENFNDFMKTLWNGENSIEVVMEGVSE